MTFASGVSLQALFTCLAALLVELVQVRHSNPANNCRWNAQDSGHVAAHWFLLTTFNLAIERDLAYTCWLQCASFELSIWPLILPSMFLRFVLDLLISRFVFLLFPLLRSLSARLRVASFAERSERRVIDRLIGTFRDTSSLEYQQHEPGRGSSHNLLVLHLFDSQSNPVILVFPWGSLIPDIHLFIYIFGRMRYARLATGSREG